MAQSPSQSIRANPVPSDNRRQQRERQREDELLDEALEETFPASDPIAPATGGDDDNQR